MHPAMLLAMGDVLLIGYGNDLRRDDGLGPAVVRAFSGRPGLEVIEAHQLLPEHIEAAAAATMVILVDAAVDIAPGEVRSQRVEPTAGEGPLFDLHELDAAGLITAASTVYGRAPEAWLVTVGVADVKFGEELSPEVEAAVPEAVAAIEDLIARRDP
jgi:hydrogenase maturation protease